MFEKMTQAENYLQAIELEPQFVDVIANRVVAVVRTRLQEKRGTTVAPLTKIHLLRVGDVSLSRWAMWRKPDRAPAAAFGVIGIRITNLIAERLHLEPAQVTVKVDVDSANSISRIVFHFAEPVTQVPTN